jgi:predicted RNA-binding protein Jag
MIKRNTSAEIRRLMQKVFNVVQGYEDEEVLDAVQEAETAIQRVIEEGVEVALQPRKPALRKVQHRMIAGRGLVASSVGREPSRHLVIYPLGRGT